MPAQVRRVLIIGKQNTGKSTFARTMANEVFKNRADHLVIEPDDLGDGWAPFGYTKVPSTIQGMRMKGKNVMTFPRNNRNFLFEIMDNVFNKNLIFDDIMFRISDKPRIDMMSEILGRARQTGNNIFVTSHGITLVPAPLWSYFTDMYLMKSDDKPERSAYKIPDFDRINEAIETINSQPVTCDNDLRKYIYIKRA